MKTAIRATVILCIYMCVLPAFARNQGDTLLEGLEAYSRNDWPAAVLFFRKAVSSPQMTSADAWYWLVMSEMSGGWYESALKDSDTFIVRYPSSPKYADILYQRGRALYQLHRREESIKQLNIFYQGFPSNSLASSALYWISESLYDMGYFNDALLLYNKIVNEYPSSPKREASVYRIALIEQRARENELLRLLKETHETALRAADEFERRSRNYEQTIQSNQKRIADLTKNTRYEDLEKEITRLTMDNTALNSRIQALDSAAKSVTSVQGSERPAVNVGTSQDITEELRKLREKALIIQQKMEAEDGVKK